MNLHGTLVELKTGLDRQEYTSVDLTQAFLSHIEKHDRYNAFVTRSPEVALAEARLADQRLKAGKGGPLTGLPLGQKDIFCTQGVKTTCSSRMLENFVAPYDATVVQRLRDAGMVMVGKTNMDEFAMGSSNETSYFGAVSNPWDVSRVPGGSSGGSAAAVAGRLVPATTGTDTGGSIRQPAALCGVTGLKPTYGRVSRFGMIAFASSMDSGGPIAQTAEDCALLLEAMAGFDPKDSTSVNRSVDAYSTQLNQTLKGLKIGLPTSVYDRMDPEIRIVFEAGLKTLEAQGCEFIEITLPHLELSMPVYYILAPAEASSNLARYDGVRYGYRCSSPKNLQDLYERTRAEGFGSEVKRRILLGTYLLSGDNYEAYYRKAQKIRRLITQDFLSAYEKVNVIALPTSPCAPFKIGERSRDPVSMYLADAFTLPMNLAGIPGISFPCGFSEGLPVGMQIIGPHFAEGRLLNVAHQFQLATDFHQRKPAGV